VTKDLEKCDGSFEHVAKLICAQEMCSKCQAVDNLSVDLNRVLSLSTTSGKTP
jgi:hypothetical protein